MKLAWRGLGRIVLAWAALGAVATAAVGAEPRLPTEAFSQSPALSDVTLSPSGERVAGLINDKDETLLFARKAGGGEGKALLSTDNRRFTFGWVRWVNDERLLVSVRFPSRRGFVPTVETRVLSVRFDGTALVNLVHYPMLATTNQVAQLQDRVVDWLPEDGRHVLLQLNTEGGRFPAVYRVNVETGERKMVQRPERDVHTWITDAQHRVRVAVRDGDKGVEVLLRGVDGGDWRTLWKFEPLSHEAVYPLGFGTDPETLYVQADHEGHRAVFEVDLRTPELKRTLKLSRPDRDVMGDLLHAAGSGEAIGVEGQVMGDTAAAYWSTTHRALAQAIDKALPQRFNELRGFSRDGHRYLLYSSGNGIPGQYFLGDRRTGDLSLLGDTFPQLPLERLAGKRVVDIKARDGLELQAFLTRPRGAAEGPLPLVLLPHGGPQWGDSMDFDVWTEFLAARGLAVLQVNFRGSTSYGHSFMSAGLQRWGLEMQDDLTDAVHWAVGEKIADPKRICIVGASYGGYAALMGAVKTPELYRCAASFAGVSDLFELWHHADQYLGGSEMLDRQVGHVWRDRERLRATSPRLHAEKVAAPVLLVHGNADRTVPYEQSELMASALRKAEKPHRLVILEDADHHLSRASDHLQFLQELERFLAQHLGL